MMNLAVAEWNWDLDKVGRVGQAPSVLAAGAHPTFSDQPAQRP